jgi:hypothetical protein
MLTPMSTTDEWRLLVYDYAMVMKGVLRKVFGGLYDYVVGMGRTAKAFTARFWI